MARITIPSTVSGVVWQVAVAVGDEVSSGDTVIVVESMKMEIVIESPVAGRVAALHVATDDAVDEGQALLEIDG